MSMDTPLAPDERFWEILTELGVFEASHLSEFRRNHRRPWRQLGEILIRQGALSVKQVGGLLNMQVDEPHMRIGDLAVREGLIDEVQLAKALGAQRRSSPHPLELLAEDDRAPSGSAFQALVAYVRHLEGTVCGLERQLFEARKENALV